MIIWYLGLNTIQGEQTIPNGVKKRYGTDETFRKNTEETSISDFVIGDRSGC